MDMKNVIRPVFWGLLYGVFVVAALRLRRQMVTFEMSEIWGWDYQTFVSQIGDWRWICYMGFRHPGLGVVMSPLVVLQHLWSGTYLLVMPAVATVTAWLIYRMSGWIGLGIWLSFPVTWIMAGTPESFPLAQLALVAGCYWLLNGKCLTARWGEHAMPLISGAFGILNASITLTNGLKPVLGYLSLHGRKMNRKLLLEGGALALVLGLLCVGVFYVRTIVTGRGMGAGIMATLSWIPAERNLWFEFSGFFVRPVGVLQSCLVYPVAVWAVVRMICGGDFKMLRLLMPMFAVDVVIHLVVGWGMSEPWVFSPHWVWMLPMIIGKGFALCKSKQMI